MVDSGISAANKFTAEVSGIATLSAGTITVTNSKYTATCGVHLSTQGGGTIANIGFVFVDAATSVVGTNFVIKSLNILDNNKVFWTIMEP